MQPSANLNLSKSVSLLFNPALYWRESMKDGLYNIAGEVIVPGLTSNARYIATQGSAEVHWQMTRNLGWFTEFGYFFPGDFLKQATPGKNINYWTSWLDIRF